MKNNSIYTIFITSNEPWGDVWYSKQHYANELAKLGNNVYFINAPLKWKASNLFNTEFRTKKIDTNLTLVEYNNPFPLRFFKRFFLKLNDSIIGKKLKNLIKNDKNKILWWQFDPFRFVNIPAIPTSKRLYHVVDPYQHIWSDAIIAKKADLIVVVSRFYKKRYNHLNRKTICIPHGISQNELSIDDKKLNLIKKEIGSDYIIFVGTINPDVNIKLIEKIALEIPNTKIIIIGPVVNSKGSNIDLKSLKKTNNIIHLGAINANLLKEYVKLASVTIVPYNVNKSLNVHRTPLKILNYIAQSKIIITTLNYEIEQLNNVLIYKTENSEEFIALIKNALNNQLHFDQKAILDYQQSVLYPKLINTIFDNV